MGLLVISGVVMVAALLVTLCRVFPLRIVLGYATSLDVIFTVGIITLYAGTYSGLMAATIAGLILAITLTVARKIFGYTYFRPRLSGWRVSLFAVEVPGILTHAAKGAKYAYRCATHELAEHSRNLRPKSGLGSGRVQERHAAEQEASGFCYRPAEALGSWSAVLPR